MRKTFLLLALLAFLPALFHCIPLFVLTAPNILRVEDKQNVVVEGHGSNEDLKVEIRLSFFTKNDVIFRTEGRLSSSNNYQILVPVMISRERIKFESTLPQYVVLEAQSPAFHLMQTILISYQLGHIFIQTDKPIYTPTQTVHYRLFTVNNEMKPTKTDAFIDFVNPQGLIVKRVEERSRNPSSIIGSTFPIPKIANIGIWKITVSYRETSHVNYTTTFEVKEYVLPSFEVMLESKEKFFYVDDTKLDVSITARFTYGKPVEGRAFVMFGIMADGERIGIPSSLQSVAIIDGRGTASLRNEVLQSSFPNIYEFVGCSIYITASVITHTGSDMVEAEKLGIKIVTTPYTISFTKTSKYFKPGMPFDLRVYVANPDGSPASGIPVKASNGEYNSRTQANGQARLSINTGGQQSSLSIKVETNVANIPKNHQASASMVAEPYRTQAGSVNYLHINIQQTVLNPGTDLSVQLNLRNNDVATQNQINYFTYMVISKGMIMNVGQQLRVKDQITTILQIPVTPNLIPSFRLLVYYYLTNGMTVEMVADSVWIDVKDTCMGRLMVSAANKDDENRIYRPGNKFELKITGDSGATVGFAAVDKAVFTLNRKNKLTQSKIWDIVEKNDIGCTPGSGSDVLGVFTDAGLTIVTSSNLKTPTRTDLKCKQPMKRKRRSMKLMDIKAAKLQQYYSTERTCCRDGMRPNPMSFSCNKRAKRITLKEDCKAAFLDCCNRIQEFKDQQRTNQMILARSDDDAYYTPYEDILLRSNFPESWLWIQRILPINDKTGVATTELSGILVDSITTWEIQAISMSADKGICVAEPYDLIVTKDFFIDLRLPYSVVRNEQVEIRAVLYNYGTEDITVNVVFPYNRKICSAATQATRLKQILNIPKKGSTAVPYIIVPLEVGQISIEVKASVSDRFIVDGVSKPLLVLPDGKETDLQLQVYDLDPKGEEQKIDVEIKSPQDVVPKTEPNTFISIQGDSLAQTIENSIDGANLKHLIRVPTGCGEQNMVHLTPGVIVTKFLDNTRQWERVGIEKRAVSLQHIRQGYAQQLTFRKDDGSYAAFLHIPSSTWLTAYVLKVLAMSSDLISTDTKHLCEAAKWLINKQLIDGRFKEDAPVLYLKTMTGGLGDAENDAALTAFVLIAMFEADGVCSTFVENYENSIAKAGDYLGNQFDNLKKAYSVAITAYALSLLKKNKLDTLMKFASEDQSYWTDAGNASSLYTIEATGYALLTLVQLKEFDKAGKLVKWLSQRGEYGGGYSSTQVTMVALQALTNYRADIFQEGEIDLNVTITISGRSGPIPWYFNSDNRYVTKTEQINNFGNFTVKAKGKGQGTLKVLTRYYARLSKAVKECKNFDLRVTVDDIPQANRPQDALSSLAINIYARYLGDSDSSMAILDISMLTGFSPDLEDLNLLQNGVDRYISRYELDKSLTMHGSLIIYLNSVSNTEDTQVGFKVHQFYKVGLIQPASVEVYEYYNKENSCRKFYNVNENNAMLSKICQGEVCKCVEGGCLLVKLPEHQISYRERLERSCEHAIAYVYKVSFHKKEKRDNYINYEMRVLIVIKQGTDDVYTQNIRELIIHANCEEIFNVELEHDYLLMGQVADLWKDNERIYYVIGNGAWIEWWPSNVQCQNQQYARVCQQLEEFREILMVNGCDY
ncbi:complement C3-like [Stegostoma tigrinum]|uniref:complement C3-like n=1 Tax=Stegostoma tigrinum TaxID=3053191 RepID=UPI00286FF198|nr:complement C3-like [Stegostoma tigrinum]